MELGSHRIGSRRHLGAEHGTPLLHRHEQDVVRRGLGRNAFWHADRLKHRIGIRQRNNPGDLDVERRHADALDRHGIPRRDVKIGCCLCGN